MQQIAIPLAQGVYILGLIRTLRLTGSKFLQFQVISNIWQSKLFLTEQGDLYHGLI